MATNKILVIILAVALLGLAVVLAGRGLNKVPEAPEPVISTEEVGPVEQGQSPAEIAPGGSLGGVFAIKPIDWRNPDSPMASAPLKESDIPKEAIQLEVSRASFSPDVFTVKAGQKIILSVHGSDDLTHVFKFKPRSESESALLQGKDASLSEVAMGVSAGETRAITFYAPRKVGEYNFFCEMPSHESRGEKGKMLVK